MTTIVFLDILLLVWLHWISDFVFQTDNMAMNKSSSIKWLSIHIGVYMIPFFWFGWQFALINGALHWVTDFFTSKWSGYYCKAGKIGLQFKVIGLDQAIHLTCLLGTYYWLFV